MKRERDLPGQRASFELDRRALLAGAVALVGGTLVGYPDDLLAATTGPPRFFEPTHFALLEEIAEIIIPRTDTPGARDAGVAGFIDALMADWASSEHAAEFRALLDEIDAHALSRGGAGLLSLPQARRIETVADYDAAQIAAGNRTYRRFKELVLTAYYWSEPGATQELRYELAPGIWEPRLAIGADTRAWAV
jgi:hypothetical protein